MIKYYSYYLLSWIEVKVLVHLVWRGTLKKNTTSSLKNGGVSKLLLLDFEWKWIFSYRALARGTSWLRVRQGEGDWACLHDVLHHAHAGQDVVDVHHANYHVPHPHLGAWSDGHHEDKPNHHLKWVRLDISCPWGVWFFHIRKCCIWFTNWVLI